MHKHDVGSGTLWPTVCLIGALTTITSCSSTQSGGSDLGPATECTSGQPRAFEPQPAHPRIWLTSERLARLREQQKSGSAAWQQLVAAVQRQDGLPRGVTSALLYTVTGDATYASQARSDVLAFCASHSVLEKDQYMSDGQDPALVFDWVYDKLSSSDRQTLVQWLNTNADTQWKSVIDNNQATDSDATTGGAKSALLAAIATAGDNSRAKEWHDKAMKVWDTGALDWLGTLQSIKGTYIARSAGGIEMEGPKYSPDTVRYMFEMAAAEAGATGRGLLCEIQKQTGQSWARDVALATVQIQIPGYTDGFTWSDIESTDWPMQPERWAAANALAIDALGSSDQVARWAQNFLDHGPTNISSVSSPFLGALYGQFHVESHVMPFYHPNGAQESTSSLPLTHVAAGPGVVIARTSNDKDATGVWMQPGSIHRVDHVHFDAGSFQLYRKGEWLTREVRGYGLWANTTRAHNSILLDGIGPQELMAYVYGDAKTTVACESGSDYVHAAGDLTAAFNVDRSRDRSDHPPADRAVEAVRQFVFVRPAGWLVVFDRLEVKQASQKKEIIFLTMSQPTINGGTITSKSIKGSNLTAGARQAGTQTLVISTIFPKQGVSYTPVDETSYYKTPRPELSLNGAAGEWEIPTAERRWHVLAKLPGSTARETALHVLVGLDDGQTAPQLQALEADGKQGVRIVDATGNGAEIMFRPSGAVGGTFRRVTGGAAGSETDLSVCR